MPRAATTTDVFNAIAEPRRRQIIELLAARGTLGVGALVLAMGLPQPAISKHLGVLRQVGLVSSTQQGPQRLYRIEPERLREVNDWIKQFDRFWTHQLDRIKQRAEANARLLKQQPKRSSPEKGSP